MQRRDFCEWFDEMFPNMPDEVTPFEDLEDEWERETPL